jgi:hypothetical protein
MLGERVFLFQKYLFTLALELHLEDEIIAIYTTLKVAFESLPGIFTEVFRDHTSVKQVVSVYTQGTKEKIVECGLALFKSMAKEAQKLNTYEPFKEVGFEGFRKHTINF